MSLLIFILILVALIWVHELGHFSAAKLFGIRVDEFGIGFPPRLLRIKWGETEYTFNLLLVGGFVKIHGEDPGEEGVARDPRSMASKPRPVQALVIVAGVLMNLLFAWLVFSVGYAAGMPTSASYDGIGTVTNVQPTIVGVMPGSPAQTAGLQEGDIIKSIETSDAKFDLRTLGRSPTGEALNTDRQAQQITDFIAAHQDQSLVVTVQRGDEEKTVVAKGVEGLVSGRKAVGMSLDDVGTLRLPPHLALMQGAVTTGNITVLIIRDLGSFFGNILRGAANFTEVAGPVGIATIGSRAVETGFAQVVTITALISINLAVINLLPIPGLDGGRLLIIIIEGVLRRPVTPKVVTALTVAGLLFIVTLMVLVTYHDIAKLVG
jgi:regulator of sigma E protease